VWIAKKLAQSEIGFYCWPLLEPEKSTLLQILRDALISLIWRNLRWMGNLIKLRGEELAKFRNESELALFFSFHNLLPEFTP